MAFDLRSAHARIVGPAEEIDDVPCTAHKSAPFALGSAPVCTNAGSIARRAAPPAPVRLAHCRDLAAMQGCRSACSCRTAHAYVH